MQPSEETLRTHVYALDRASRPEHLGPRFGIVGAVAELTAWLADDRQSTRAGASNWASLLDDVAAAFQECGPHVADVLTSTGVDVTVEVSEVRSAIKSRRQPPDAALRRRLGIVAAELTRLFRTPDARVAALADALAAAASRPETAIASCHRLVALAEVAGRQDRWVGRSVADALSNLRGDNGRAIGQRLTDARAYLRSEAQPADVVIWLRIEYADVGWPPIIRLGPHVTLFNAKWLSSVLRGGGDQLKDQAPEAHEDPGHVEHLIESDRRSGDAAQPAAILRVNFDHDYVPRAHERALQTAEALAGLACLYGAHPGTWIVADEYRSYLSGSRGGMSISADEHRQIPAFPNIVLQGDRAAQLIADVGDELGRHLPIADDDIAEAGRLLHWLRQARLSSSPPRVLLHDRILEQVSGWAGVDDLRQFVREYLRLEWVHGRIHLDIFNAAVGAQYILLHEDVHSSLLAEYCEQPHDLHTAINLRSFLVAVERVRGAVEATDSVWRHENPLTVLRLRRVAEAAASPNARRMWLTGLLKDFERLENRRRRTRNSLVHGGPLAQPTIESVVDFAEQLAARALGASIEGRLLKRRNLIDHFLVERGKHELMARRLREGSGLAYALFPPEERGALPAEPPD